MDQKLQDMMRRVARLGELSEVEARRIVNEIHADGIVSRTEAEALFLMSDSLASADVGWGPRFVETIRDFLLTHEAPLGWVTQEEADWLIAQLDRKGGSLIAIDLVGSLLRHAEGAPIGLSRFGLSMIAQAVKAAGLVDADMVARIRIALHASAGEAGTWVNRFEATTLFEINDAVAFARNDPAWNALFARAIGNHLLACAHPDPMSESQALARQAWLEDTSSASGAGLLARFASAVSNGNWFANVTFDAGKAAAARSAARESARRAAGTVSADENSWFMKRLGWDQKVSPAERALIDFLTAEAPGFAQGLAAAA